MKTARPSAAATAEFTKIEECEPGWLFGVCTIFGVRHHAEFIRVEYVNETMEVWHPAGAGADGITDNHNEDRMNDLQQYFPGAYGTVKVPGFEGEYAMVVFPHDIS